MAANPCGREVPPEQAYEVWQSEDGTWTYYVLKKYQRPEKEAENPFARWKVNVRTPYTPPGGDTQDAYVSSVKSGTHKLDYNPLTEERFDAEPGGSDETVDPSPS